jgi:hypothetical protein
MNNGIIFPFLSAASPLLEEYHQGVLTEEGPSLMQE